MTKGASRQLKVNFECQQTIKYQKKYSSLTIYSANRLEIKL